LSRGERRIAHTFTHERLHSGCKRIYGTEHSGVSVRLGSAGPGASGVPPLNLPATIGRRYYTGHALDVMQARGITPSVVEHTIRCGQRYRSGSEYVYYDKINNVTVVTNKRGDVISTRRGQPSARGRGRR